MWTMVTRTLLPMYAFYSVISPPIFGLILSKALQTFRLANRVFHVSQPGSPPRPVVTLEVSTICVRECEGKPMGFLEVARVTINTRQRPFLIKDSKKVGKKTGR